MWIVRSYLDLWTINVYIAFDRSVIVSYCYFLKKEEHFVTGTTCSIYVLNILASKSLEALCVSSTRSILHLNHVLYLTTLNEVRMQSLSIFNIPPFDRYFFVSTNCFCGRYKLRVVYSYVLSDRDKPLTSKMMPIKARIFWNAIAVPG